MRSTASIKYVDRPGKAGIFDFAVTRELDTESAPGVPMPLYLSQHTLACLTRQGADALAQRFQSTAVLKTERILVNMIEGKMFCELRAESREALEAWLKSEGMHFDWLLRIEWETSGGPLRSAS